MMRSATTHLSVNTVRADALFASALQRSDEPTAAQVRQAITEAIRTFGPQGCVARVAQAFGEHPETAVLRMRWARRTLHGDGKAAGLSGTGHRQSPTAPRPGQRTVLPPRQVA
jgi:hypothetical protein